MNDFRQIKLEGKLLQMEEFNWLHEVCINFIRKNVKESNAAHIVMITHHLSTYQIVALLHKGSVLNSVFASKGRDLIANNQIDA